MTHQPPPSEAAGEQGSEPQLVPFGFWLAHAPMEARSDTARSNRAAACPLTPSLATLQQAMARELEALGHPDAEPLRWAITGVDPQRGLRLEGIGLDRAAAAAGAPPATNRSSPGLQARVQSAGQGTRD